MPSPCDKSPPVLFSLKLITAKPIICAEQPATAAPPARPVKPSAAQIAAKARFAKVSAAVRAILAGSSEQKTQLVAEYNAQNKIGSLFGYAMKKLNGKFRVR